MESRSKKRTSITIDPEVFSEAKKFALDKDISLSNLIEDALRTHLAVERAESNGVPVHGTIRNAV